MFTVLWLEDKMLENYILEKIIKCDIANSRDFFSLLKSTSVTKI